MKGQMIGSSDSKRRVGFLFQSFSLTSSIYHRENAIYSGRSGVQGSDGLSRRSKSSRKEESLDPSDACVFDWAQKQLERLETWTREKKVEIGCQGEAPPT
jgi:hypothetical protein